MSSRFPRPPFAVPTGGRRATTIKGAASVIACMDEELPATVEGTPLRLARHFFLGQVLLRTEVNLPMAQLVSMGLEYIRLADELKDVLAGVHEPDFDRAMAGRTVRPIWPASPALRLCHI